MKMILVMMICVCAQVSRADLSNSIWVPRSLDLPPLSLDEAQDYCKNQAGRLPSADDFRVLMMQQLNGLPEAPVLPDGTYWTSTEHLENLAVEYVSDEHAFGVTNRASRNLVVCLVDL